MYMIEDRVPFSFTLAVLSVRKLDIHLVRLIGKSSFASLSLSPSYSYIRFNKIFSLVLFKLSYTLFSSFVA